MSDLTGSGIEPMTSCTDSDDFIRYAKPAVILPTTITHNIELISPSYGLRLKTVAAFRI